MLYIVTVISVLIASMIEDREHFILPTAICLTIVSFLFFALSNSIYSGIYCSVNASVWWLLYKIIEEGKKEEQERELNSQKQ